MVQDWNLLSLQIALSYLLTDKEFVYNDAIMIEINSCNAPKIKYFYDKYTQTSSHVIMKRITNPRGKELKSLCSLRVCISSVWSPVSCSSVADFDEPSPCTDLIVRRGDRHRSLPGRPPSDNPTFLGFAPTRECPGYPRPNCETAPALPHGGLLRAIGEAQEQRTNY